MNKIGTNQKRTAVAVLVTGVFGLLIAWYISQPNDDPLAEGPVILNEQPVASDTVDPVPYKVEQVVTGLNVPWSIVFTSSDRWLVSERSGQIRIVEDGTLRDTPLIVFDQVTSQNEEGLMGLALDPQYAENKYVYACYATIDGDGYVDEVVRFEDRGDSTGPLVTIIDQIPAARFHAGCRLSFGPDGKLYITTGDATTKDIAQDLESLGGKILRVNADGSVPDDNPFPGSPIWSYGHRNPQGIAWQPETNQLYATEHGPSGNDGPNGGDEVNVIEKGANYGWPVVSHEEEDARFVSPLLVFTPAVAPSGALFYDSDVLPQFRGDLLFAALAGKGIVRVQFSDDDPSSITRYERLSDIDVGRVRDVVQGPDGAIYVLTSNRDGRGEVRDGDDAVYRIGVE